MKLLVHTILIVLATKTYAFNELIPPDKELVYSWTADVKAGTHSPASYASQLVLQGKIHLQSSKHSIFAKITNLNHRLYNGAFDNDQEYESQSVPVPAEAQDLEKVFRIEYNGGVVKGIGTEKNEKEFSRNIKKALASILQLNSSLIDKEFESFTVSEKTIYGHGTTIYDVFPLDENTTEIWRLHDMIDNEDLSCYSISNVESIACDSKPEKNLMHDSRKRYILEKQSDCFVPKLITSSGSVVYYPFQAQSDSHVVLVNQTFLLLDVVPIQETYKLESERFEKSLTYHPPVDVTKNLMPTVQELLTEVCKYLQEDHINTEDDIKRSQLIDRLQRLLRNFDHKNLEELHNLLERNQLIIFYEILPLTGTETSILFIKTLITEKRVDEDTSISLLQRLSENTKPSQDLLEKFEELVNFESWNVRKVAILTFGSLIYKSHKGKNPELYQKYVEEYINKARNSQSYVEKITYVLALRNINLPTVAQLLVPAFTGEWDDNRHFRFIALWAAATSHLSQPSQILKTLWPIFSNRNEVPEIRVLSYYFILRTRPSLSLLRNMLNYMLTDPDPELYQYHYEFCKAVMQSTDPCHKEMKLRLSQLMKVSPEPHGLSSVGFYGYRDDRYGFSGGVQSSFFKTNVSRVYTVGKYSQIGRKYEEEYGVLVNWEDGRSGDPGLFNSVLDAVKSRKDDRRVFQSDIVLVKRGQVINVWTLDDNNAHDLFPIFGFFEKGWRKFEKDLLFTHYQKYQRSIIPTDLGIPVTWEDSMPDVHNLNVTVSKETIKDEVTFHFEARYSNWVSYRHGLSFYNPINGMWQGINRYNSYNLAFPIHFDAAFNSKERSLKFNWRRHGNPLMEVAGIRSFTKQAVFATDELRHEFSFIQDKLNDYPFIEENFENLGLEVHSSFFKSDIHYPFGSFKKGLMRMIDPQNKYFHSIFQRFLASWLQFQDSLIMLPRTGNYGFIFRAGPSKKHPVTDLEMVFKIRSQGTQFSDSQIVFTVKNKEETVTVWDLVFITNNSYNLEQLKLEVTRIAPQQENYKVCFESVKELKWKEIEGYLRIGMGETDDGSIEVKTLDQFSTEQKNRKLITCQSLFQHGKKECHFSRDRYRHQMFEVATKNIPSEVKSKFEAAWNIFQHSFYQYYSHKSSRSNISDNSFKISIIYPLKTDDFDLEVTTNQERHEFTGISWGLHPPLATHISKKYRNGLVDHCSVHLDHFRFNQYSVSKKVPNDWTLFVNSSGNSIYLRQISQEIGLKATSGNEYTLEVKPVTGTYGVIANGTEILSEEYEDDWVEFKKFNENKILTVFLEEDQIYFEYQVDRVLLVIPQDEKTTGRCYQN